MRRDNSCLDAGCSGQLRVVLSLRLVCVTLSTLCITPNVALDRTLVVPRFTPGGVCRADRVYTTIGGRGLNVARALASLGKANHSTGFIGGASGEMAAQSAAGEGLTATWSRIGGETRTSLIILAAPDQATIITEPGPIVTEGEWKQFEADVTQLAHGRGAVCICGSLPPGSPPHATQRLLAAAIGHIAWDEFTLGRASDPSEIDANYVRRSDAELFWKE